MTAQRLDLMSRESFAALSKTDKDQYLQELTARYCQVSALPEVTLDKHALSRLRRFYARRSLAEPQLDTYPEGDVGQALRRLAEAMKASERQGDVLAVLKGETAPPPVLRPAGPRSPSWRRWASPRWRICATSTRGRCARL